jgi:hypothetical protein
MATWISPNTDSGTKGVYSPPPVDDVWETSFTDEWPDARDGDTGTSESNFLASSTSVANDGDYIAVDFEYTASPDYACSGIRINWSPGTDWEAEVRVGGVVQGTITASGTQTLDFPVSNMSDVVVSLQRAGSSRSSGSVTEVEFKRGQRGQATMMF